MEDHYKRGKDDRKEVRIGEEGLKVKLDFSRIFFIMSKVLTSAVFSRRSSEWVGVHRSRGPRGPPEQMAQGLRSRYRQNAFRR